MKMHAVPVDSFEFTYPTVFEDQPQHVLELSSGGYLITGTTKNYGGPGMNDMMLVKTNCSGDTLWARAYGSTGDDEGSAAIEVPGGYILTGSVKDFLFPSTKDLALIKVDLDGNPIWTKSYGFIDERGIAIAHSDENNFVVAGYTTLFGDKDGWLIKFDENGDSIWSKTEDIGLDEIFRYVQQTGSDIYVGGGKEPDPAGAQNKGIIARFADSLSFGKKIWRRQTIDSSGLFDCALLPNSIVCVGRLNLTTNSEKLYLVKHALSNGAPIWQKIIYDGDGKDFGGSIALLSDSSLAVVGRNSSAIDSVTNAWLVRFDLDGNILSEEFYAPTGNDVFRKVIDGSDNSIILLGELQGAPAFSSVETDNWLIKKPLYPPIAVCDLITGTVATPGTTNVFLSWNLNPATSNYQLRGSKIGGPFGTLTSSVNSKNIGGLSPGTSYQWQVRSLCTNGAISAYTALDTFTTNTLRSEHQAEKAIRSIELWPNPADEFVIAELPSELLTEASVPSNDFTVAAIDGLGREFVLSYTLSGNRLLISTRELSQGAYLLRVQSPASNIYHTKVVLR